MNNHLGCKQGLSATGVHDYDSFTHPETFWRKIHWNVCVIHWSLSLSPEYLRIVRRYGERISLTHRMQIHESMDIRCRALAVRYICSSRIKLQNTNIPVVIVILIDYKVSMGIFVEAPRLIQTIHLKLWCGVHVCWHSACFEWINYERYYYFWAQIRIDCLEYHLDSESF